MRPQTDRGTDLCLAGRTLCGNPRRFRIDDHVGQERWDAIVSDLVDAARQDRITDGFVTAIEQAGVLLAEHFPPRPDNQNELDDRLVEI